MFPRLKDSDYTINGLRKTHKKGVSLLCHSQSEGPELTRKKRIVKIQLTPSTYMYTAQTVQLHNTIEGERVTFFLFYE